MIVLMSPRTREASSPGSFISLIFFFAYTPDMQYFKERIFMSFAIIETGGKIRMVPMETETFSVDTPEDLQKVQQAMANDKLISRYRN